MSLYDGLDMDAKAVPIRSGNEELSGWGTSLKLLETQKQLQAKKCVLQNVKRKPQGTILAPVIDLKGRRGEAPSELRFNQITGKLEAIVSVGSFIGSEPPLSFFGVKDEYDPLKPNDYESFVKARREDRQRERDDDGGGRDRSAKVNGDGDDDRGGEDGLMNSRRSRHEDRENRRSDRRRDDDDDDYDNSRRRDRDRDRDRDRERDRGDRDRDRDRERERERERDRDRDDDEGEFDRRRRRRAEEEEDDDRSRRSSSSRTSGAAIAPPPSLMDLEIPTPEPILAKEKEAAAALADAQRPEGGGLLPGTKFGMGGSVASKIMARMGYREGQGLGKSEQGMSIALQVEKTSKRGGKIIHERDLAKIQEREMVAAVAAAAAAATAASSTPPPQQTKLEMSNAQLLRNPSKVIVLRNMVGPGEVDSELEGETAEECSKYGKVTKCLIFEIPEGDDEEAVRIFLEFERMESAIKAVVDLNGRYFGGRIVKGNFYNLDKFRRFDLGDPIE